MRPSVAADRLEKRGTADPEARALILWYRYASALIDELEDIVAERGALRQGAGGVRGEA